MPNYERRQSDFSGKQTRYFPSIKTGLTFKLDSEAERTAAKYLEFDDNVISYRAQPASVKPDPNKPLSRYTVDFGVLLINKTKELRELKMDYQFDDPDVSLRLDKVDERLMMRYGQKLVRWKYSDIDKGSMVSNLQRFYPFRRFDLTRFDLKKVGKHLRTVQTLDDLFGVVSHFNAPPSFPFALLAQKKVVFDFECEFVPSTSVEVNL